MPNSVPDIAARTGLTGSAVTALRDAMIRGRGIQAQFDHPELGGMGQWMRGGMVMLGDMFNTELAQKVSLACQLLSGTEEIRAGATPLKWWPHSLGEPSQCASQNALGYAYFPTSGRLAVRRNDVVELYDLSGLTFHGVGAQSGSLIVHTSAGPRTLDELPLVEPGS